MVRINFYDNPKIVGIAKPGLIIEAEPSSRVTSAYFGRPFIHAFPTGAYGYVMGSLNEEINTNDEPQFEKAQVMNFPDTTLVQRLTYLKNISKNQTIDPLISWFSPWSSLSLAKNLRNKDNEINENEKRLYQGPVLALGEIDSDSNMKIKQSKLTSKFADNFFYLTEEDQESLRGELLDYHFHRRKNDFYAKLPDGTIMPIEDLEIISKFKKIALDEDK